MPQCMDRQAFPIESCPLQEGFEMMVDRRTRDPFPPGPIRSVVIFAAKGVSELAWAWLAQ